MSKKRKSLVNPSSKEFTLSKERLLIMAKFLVETKIIGPIKPISVVTELDDSAIYDSLKENGSLADFFYKLKSSTAVNDYECIVLDSEIPTSETDDDDVINWAPPYLKIGFFYLGYSSLNAYDLRRRIKVPLYSIDCSYQSKRLSEFFLRVISDNLSRVTLTGKWVNKEDICFVFSENHPSQYKTLLALKCLKESLSSLGVLDHDVSMNRLEVLNSGGTGSITILTSKLDKDLYM